MEKSDLTPPHPNRFLGPEQDGPGTRPDPCHQIPGYSYPNHVAASNCKSSLNVGSTAMVGKIYRKPTAAAPTQRGPRPLLFRSLSLYPRTKVSSIHQFRKAFSPRCDGNPRFSLLFSSDQAATMANSASGMAVNDDCKLKFLELKAKRTYRFIIYKIDEKLKQVVVDKVGEPTLNYEDFTANLSASECRYAVYDFEFFTEENVPKSKIFFIAWSPDTSKVRNKMLYASTKESFKRELDGIQVELQATDPSEIHLDVIKGRAN